MKNYENDFELFLKDCMNVLRVDGITQLIYDDLQEKYSNILNKKLVALRSIRQNRKTTSAINYMIYSVLFKKHFNMVIMSYNKRAARYILDRFETQYSLLRNIEKIGYIRNKNSIKFENGVVIKVKDKLDKKAILSTDYLYVDEYEFSYRSMSEFLVTIEQLSINGAKIHLFSTPSGLFKSWFYKALEDYSFEIVVLDRL